MVTAVGLPSPPTFLLRRAVRLAAAFVLLLLTLDASAAVERWYSLTTVSEVTVRVHWVSVAELRAAARLYGKRPKSTPAGLAVLKWNPATGKLVCHLFLTAEPTRVDDRATMTLGHEMAHCLGFSHQHGPRDPVRPRLASGTQ